MSKNFTNKLRSKKSTSTKKRQLTDAEIEAAFESGTSPAPPVSTPVVENENERLYLRIPKHLHDRLKAVSKELGVTKSAIVKQGITAELNRLQNK